MLTNGMNVGGRAGTAGGARGRSPPGAETLDVQAGQGLRLQFVNAATVAVLPARS